MSQHLSRWTLTAVFGLLGAASAAPALPSAALAQEAVRDALAPVPMAVQRALPAASAQAASAQAASPASARPMPAAQASSAPSASANAAARAAQVARAQAQAAQQAGRERARVQAAAQARAQAAQRAAQQAAQARARAVQQAQQQAARQAAQAPTRTGRSAVVRATAYNSTPGQTDSTPFITATGTRVRNGVVALSRDLLRTFPYGSKIMIEDLSGRYNNLLRGRVFSVEDTMASYKRGSLDIWMVTRTQAIQFGARQVRITAVR